MNRLLQLTLLCLVASVPASAACSGTALGAFTCIQACNNWSYSGTTITCSFSSALTAGSEIVVTGLAYATETSMVYSGCSLTFSDLDGIKSGGSGWFNQAWAANSGTGSCTVTLTVGTSASKGIFALEIGGSNQTVDAHSLRYAGTVTAGNPITPTAITTAVDGDLIIEFVIDVTGSSVTYTAGSGTLFVQTSDYWAAQGQIQTAHGSVTPNVTASGTYNFSAGAIALDPTGGGGPPACKPTLTLLGVGRCN